MRPLELSNKILESAGKVVAKATVRSGKFLKKNWGPIATAALLLSGGGLLVAGIAQIFGPAAFIAAGAGLLYLGWTADLIGNRKKPGDR